MYECVSARLCSLSVFANDNVWVRLFGACAVYTFQYKHLLLNESMFMCMYVSVCVCVSVCCAAGFAQIVYTAYETMHVRKSVFVYE